MRVLAIGDIHGCLGALDDLLAWVRPEPDDALIMLGDSVDRGPDSRGVLNRLIELKKRRPVICLRGNHEVMMLEARDNTSERKNWLSVGGAAALGSYGRNPGRSGSIDDVPAEHWHFLEHELVDYHETERFIFVHATVLFACAMDQQPGYALFWEFLGDRMTHYTGKTIICGHTSQKSGVPKVVPNAVCIDTHAYGGGWLTCLDAISGRYWQVDLLGRRREGEVNYEEE